MNSKSVIVGFLRSRNCRMLYAARLSFRSGLSLGRLIGSMATARPGGSATAAEAARNWRRESVMRETPEGSGTRADSLHAPRAEGIIRFAVRLLQCPAK